MPKEDDDKTGEAIGAGAGALIGALVLGPVGAAFGALLGYGVGEATKKGGHVARKVFYSFHYSADGARAGQVRNIGVVEGSQPVSDNDWETVKRGGDAAIEKWIAEQLAGKSCIVLLIGYETAGRKWINHEIIQGYNKGMGLFGIYIHRLKNLQGMQSLKGANPFANIKLDGGKGAPLSDFISVYDPPQGDSKAAYAYISDNLSDWVEAAIKQRQG